MGTHYRSDNVRFFPVMDLQQKKILPNAHQFWELIYITAGQVTYNVNGKTYYLTKNCLIITRPHAFHTLDFHGAAPYGRYVVQFTQDLLGSDICDRLPEHIDVVNFDGNERACSLFPNMDTYLEHFDEGLIRPLILHSCEEMLCNVLLAPEDACNKNMHIANPLIQQATDYIKENVRRPIAVSDVAEHLYISKAYLHNLFLQHLQTTPKKYIVAQKLLLAQQELRNGGKAIKIYADYGFADYSTFYRHYVHHFGHSPSQEPDMPFPLDVNLP